MKTILSDADITEVIDRGDVVEGNRFLPFAYARAIEAKLIERIGEASCYMTPDGEGLRMRTNPPVVDTKLGWTPLYAIPFGETK